MITEKTTLGDLGQWLTDRLLGCSVMPNGGALATWTATVRRGDVAWTGEGNTPTEALDSASEAFMTSGTPRMTTTKERPADHVRTRRRR